MELHCKKLNLNDLENLCYFDNPDRLGFAGWIAIIFVGIVSLAFFVELGFRRGTIGPNRYGPDPLELRT